MTCAREDMAKLKSEIGYHSLHAVKGHSQQTAEFNATRSNHRTTGNTGKPTQSGVYFAELLQTTERLYASTRSKRGKKFDTSAVYSNSTETPLALQATTETEHIHLVFFEKANTRAAIVIEKSLWDTDCQFMIWTQFSEDCAEDGMTIDYVSCRQRVASGTHSQWTSVPSEEPVSDLSAQASIAFISYLNKISV